MKIPYRLILFVAICLYADLLTYGQQWEYSLDKYGRHTAQISANGQTPDGVVKTTLSIQLDCRPTKDFQLKYIITGARNLKTFNFVDFEGHGSPVYMKGPKLMTIKMRFKSGYEILKIGVIGWFEGPDIETAVFVFNRLEYKSFKYNYGDELSRLVKALQKNPTSISVSVQSYSDRSKVIHTEFPGAGLSMALTKILRGCDKPVKQQ